MVIDRGKLNHVRELIDEAVAEQVLDYETTRSMARDRLAKDFGFHMVTASLRGWAITSGYIELEMLEADELAVHEPDSSVAFEAATLASRSVQAPCVDDAETAFLCRILDEHVDLAKVTASRSRYPQIDYLNFWHAFIEGSLGPTVAKLISPELP